MFNFNILSALTRDLLLVPKMLINKIFVKYVMHHIQCYVNE